MDQTSTTNNDQIMEDDEVLDTSSFHSSVSCEDENTSSTETESDEKHDPIMDKVLKLRKPVETWHVAMLEDFMRKSFLACIPKPINGIHIHKNVRIACLAEIDLIVVLNDIALVVELKSSVNRHILQKGKNQVDKQAKCISILQPNMRVFGILYTPFGPKVLLDIGNKDCWHQYFQSFFAQINYRKYTKPKGFQEPELDSQSGKSVKSFTFGKRKDNLPLSGKEQLDRTEGPSSVVIDAGSHHSARMRATKPSTSGFDMNNVFKDETTQKSDVKFLKAKLVENLRDPFGGGDVKCNATQTTQIQSLMQEMKIMVPSSNGMSLQETVKSVDPSASAVVGNDMDIGV